MQIGIGVQIGYQAGAGGEVGIFDYLINDTFTTDRAAGAVNGTKAEPGPGRRVVTDTDGDALLLTGGVVRLQNPNSSNGNPGLWYGGQDRQPGLLVKATVVYGAFNGFSYPCGFDADQSILGDHQFRVTGAGSLQTYEGGVGPVLASLATGTHTFVVALRLNGACYLAKPSGGSNFLLYWITSNGNFPSMKPTVSDYSQTTFDVERIVVPSLHWLPSPLISDGFGSAFGSSDGLGHAEGGAGGLGSGGGSVSWTTAYGSYTVSAGKATVAALDGGTDLSATAYVGTGTGGFIATAKVTRSAGTAGLVVRFVDTANRIQAFHDGTNLQLVKVVAGVTTVLVTSAATYVAGAPIRIVVENTKYRVFYNNAAVGTEYTISDAVFSGVRNAGIRTNNAANSFDDFVVYARGIDGEYDAVLDAL